MTALLLTALALVAGGEPPPISEAQLDKLLAPLASPDAAARLAAAEQVIKLPPAAMEVLAQRLARPLASKPDTLRRLILQIWAQVPNWKRSDPMWVRRPEPPWTPPPREKGKPRPRRPPPHDPERVDWLAALNALDLSEPDLVAEVPPGTPPDPKPKAKPKPKPGEPPVEEEPPPPPEVPTRADLEKARTEALEVVTLMRAIAASKRMDAVDPIFKVAFEHEGVFRDECGRQIRSIDSWAVPALIRLMHQKGKGLTKQRRYASYQLDRMDRARPAKAISAAPDDRVRSAIIHQYGQDRAPEAVEAVLEMVDAPSHRVRKEARWAWMRYVTGNPRPAPKRKRKLAGGREEEEEKPDYLTYKEMALLAIRKQVQSLNSEAPAPRATLKQLTEELFAFYDRRRTAEWDAQFASAQAKEQAGDYKGATDEYGWILAHAPGYPRKAEMTRAFVRQGDALREKGERAQALGYYRQAVDLDPEGPEAAYAGARVALLDALESLARGHAEPALFRRALALDPSLKEAREGLAKAESLAGRRVWLEAAGAAGGLAALFLGLWFLWTRTREDAVSAQTSLSNRETT